MLHFLGFRKKHVGTLIDLFLTFFAGIVENDVFNTLNAIEEISIEARKFGTIVYAGLFELAGENDRYNNADGNKSKQSHQRNIPA